MEWSELYGPDQRPTPENISEFIADASWKNLNDFLQETYGTPPKIAYSGCSMQRGWNVKYQKSGKSLCTLYPMPGYFIALVVIGEKEMPEAELLIPLCSAYTQELYHRTAAHMGGKWLMLEVKDTQVLADVKSLIQLRVRPKQKQRQ